MYAVVEIAGRQFKVSQNDSILVPTLKEKPGAIVKFDRILLIEGDQGVTVGHPTVSGAAVEATVLGQERGEKVIVFKKKRRKGYRVKRGHRQAYTRVQITTIAV